jgi:polysaccharide biosynthesis protein PslG
VDLRWTDVEPQPPGSAQSAEPDGEAEPSDPGLLGGLLGGDEDAEDPPPAPQGDGRDWSLFDAIVASAERHHVSLTPIVSYVPRWANGGAHYFAYPTDMGAFERFFAAALRRYPQIRAWEIWNEPNYELFARPEPRVEPFVELLRAAHRARASVGSDAKLISGGLASVGKVPMFEFFEQMADRGALELIDGLGVHPYGTASPERPRSLFMKLAELRRRLVARGKPGIQLWLTEYGVPDTATRSGYGEPGDEARQADLLRRAYAIAAHWPWVASFTWYELRDDCADGANPECRLGLLRPDFRRKQSANALRDLLAGGPFPRLRTTTKARLSRTRATAARAGRRPRRTSYHVRGSAFAPGEELSGRRVKVRVRPLAGRRPHAAARRGRGLRTLRGRIGRGRFDVPLGPLPRGRYRVEVRFPFGERFERSTRVLRVRIGARRRAG